MSDSVMARRIRILWRPNRPFLGAREVQRRILGIIEREDVAEFYIGRTVSPSRRRLVHWAERNLTELDVLLESTSVEHIQEVEAALLARFVDHAKCCNDAADSRGDTAPGKNFIYIAYRLLPPRELAVRRPI